MVVYVDVLIIINFIISYFLLLTAALLSGYTYNRKRIIISAAVGAVFCLYIFTDITAGFADIFVKIISLIICSVLAFGVENKRKLIISTAGYILLNMSLTGAVIALSTKNKYIYQNNMFYYFNINPVNLVILSGLIYLVLLVSELIKDRINPQKTYTLDIVFDDFELKDIYSFYDSGFGIKDIISNKDVIVVSAFKIRVYLPTLLAKNINNYLSGDYDNTDYLFIPIMYNTLGGNGILPAVKAKYIVYGNKKIENILVAFTQDELHEDIAAIFGTDIKKQL